MHTYNLLKLLLLACRKPMTSAPSCCTRTWCKVAQRPVARIKAVVVTHSAWTSWTNVVQTRTGLTSHTGAIWPCDVGAALCMPHMLLD